MNIMFFNANSNRETLLFKLDLDLIPRIGESIEINWKFFEVDRKLLLFANEQRVNESDAEERIHVDIDGSVYGNVTDVFHVFRMTHQQPLIKEVHIVLDFREFL